MTDACDILYALSSSHAVDEEAHHFIGEQTSSVGTFLYGRRMYETMLFWETAHLDPAHPPFVGPTAAGGGIPFLPAGLRLELELLDEHRFATGGLWLRYAPATLPAE